MRSNPGKDDAGSGGAADSDSPDGARMRVRRRALADGRELLLYSFEDDADDWTAAAPAVDDDAASSAGRDAGRGS